jgi:hypothetical protein
LPATHFVRLSAPQVDERDLSKAFGRFKQKLRRRTGCEWFAVHEWQSSHHLHLLVRTAHVLTTAEVGELWRRCLPEGVVGSHYCQPVKNPKAVARYVVKDTREGCERLPPRSFRGKHYSYSRKFFPRPVKVLWAEIRHEWHQKKNRSAPSE